MWEVSRRTFCWFSKGKKFPKSVEPQLTISFPFFVPFTISFPFFVPSLIQVVMFLGTLYWDPSSSTSSTPRPRTIDSSLSPIDSLSTRRLLSLPVFRTSSPVGSTSRKRKGSGRKT